MVLVLREDEAQRHSGLTMSLRVTKLVDRSSQVRDRPRNVTLPVSIPRRVGRYVDRLQRDERVAGRVERHPDTVENR